MRLIWGLEHIITYFVVMTMMGCKSQPTSEMSTLRIAVGVTCFRSSWWLARIPVGTSGSKDSLLLVTSLCSALQSKKSC